MKQVVVVTASMYAASILLALVVVSIAKYEFYIPPPFVEWSIVARGVFALYTAAFVVAGVFAYISESEKAG